MAGTNITIPVVETATIENIRTAIEMAHDYKDIAVIMGGSWNGEDNGTDEVCSGEFLRGGSYHGISGHYPAETLMDIARCVMVDMTEVGLALVRVAASRWAVAECEGRA